MGSRHISARLELENTRLVHYIYHTLTQAHAHTCRCTSLVPPPSHTMKAQSQVQTRACIWNQSKSILHVYCAVCLGPGHQLWIEIYSLHSRAWCLSTCKGFLKRGDWHTDLSFTCMPGTWETHVETVSCSHISCQGNHPCWATLNAGLETWKTKKKHSVNWHQNWKCQRDWYKHSNIHL